MNLRSLPREGKVDVRDCFSTSLALAPTARRPGIGAAGILAASAALLVLVVPRPVFAQKQAPVNCKGPLSAEQLIGIKGLNEPRLRHVIASCGVSFELNEKTEPQLRGAGVPEFVFGMLKKRAAPTKVAIPKQEPDTEAKLLEVRIAALRQQIPLNLTARKWGAAETLIEELLGLSPGDRQAQNWIRQAEDGRQADHLAAERVARERRLLELKSEIQQAIGAKDWTRADSLVAEFKQTSGAPAGTASWEAAIRAGLEAERLEVSRKQARVARTEELETVLKKSTDAGNWDQAAQAVGALKELGAGAAEIAEWESTIRAGREADRRAEADRTARQARILGLKSIVKQAVEARDWSNARKALNDLQATAGNVDEAAAWSEAIRLGLEADRRAAVLDDERQRREPLARELAKLKFEFVALKPQEFTMGSEDGTPDSKPARRVTIQREFEIARYEVTQAQWTAFMGANPSRFKGDDRPVEGVSWVDTQNFLAKLNARKDGYLYRLPTEAEWELAARLGATGAQSTGDMAWFDLNSGGETKPVGGKVASSIGLHDLFGNVWEWCHDWFDAGFYRRGSSQNPSGPGSGTHRVVRGGSWRNGDGPASRPWLRNWYEPGVKLDNLGFRCVRERVQ